MMVTSNIISTPNIVTLDNEEAEIKVAQEVPFVTGQFTNTNNTSSNGQVKPVPDAFSARKSGTILKITPQINEGDSVDLKIEQRIFIVGAGCRRRGGPHHQQAHDQHEGDGGRTAASSFSAD
jgi:general secretion pathway protein D